MIMKKLIVCLLALLIVICLALAGGYAKVYFADEPQQSAAATAAGRLDFGLLKEMYMPGENAVVSPLSAKLALSMAAEGAKGETLKQILAVLGAEQPAGVSPEDVESANAVFTAPGLELRGDYAERLSEGYAAQWFEIDGDVVNRVNGWVKENTNGMIEKLLSDAPAADTGMILLNAVAMNGKWSSPFDPGNTREDVFHAPGGDVNVDMMYQTEQFRYAEKDGGQIVRLPFSDSSLEMWIALPEEGGMSALLDALDREGVAYLHGDAQGRMVSLYLPKADILDENVLSDSLKRLGMELAFTAEADFSGMSDVPMCIDQVLQNARIRIDEEGTRAAAATSVAMKVYGAPNAEPPAQMKVDRPFAFVICDEESGEICFAGVIENPAA